MCMYVSIHLDNMYICIIHIHTYVRIMCIFYTHTYVYVHPPSTPPVPVTTNTLRLPPDVRCTMKRSKLR